MRALKTGGLCLLITAGLTVAATAAWAGELLVMPYRCSVIGGDVVLRPSADEGHRIVSRREQRDFTSCSPVDPTQCRRWQIHRFDVDCGGERVPWAEIVAAADRERNAWVENGSLKIRMPSWWSMSPDDPCARGPEDDRPFGGRGPFCARKRARLPPTVVSMPYGFAPKFGLDAIFVADDRAPPMAGREPLVGGYEARRADRDLAPVLAEGPRSAARPTGPKPDNIPFKVAPPGEGLSVEPSPAEERAPAAAESEPQITWAAPPPLPPRLDPSERRAMAENVNRRAPSAATETAEAPPVLVAPPAPATSAAPTIINRPGTGAGKPSPSPIETASAKTQAPDQRSGTSAGVQVSGAQTNAEAESAPVATPQSSSAPETAVATPPSSTVPQGNVLDPVETSPETSPAGLAARILRGEPGAVAVAVISGGLLAILIVGLTMSRRRGASRPDETSHDLASVSLEKGFTAEPAFAAPDPELRVAAGARAAPPMNTPAVRAPTLNEPRLSEPTLSAPPADQAPPRRPVPVRRAAPAHSVPAPVWGNAIPQSHAEALRVLGMGVRGDSSPASIKKIVDGLRMSWHPDRAENEADRKERELRLKQINAAWEIISGKRPAAPDTQELRRPETLQL